MPIEYMAWSSSKEIPFFTARDLPIAIPSMIQSRAISMAVPASVSIACRFKLGSEIDQEVEPIAFSKCMS